MPNELLPEDQWGNYRSDEEIENNMCKVTQEALSREQLAEDDETRFLRSTKVYCAIPIRELTVQLNIARKKHPNKLSKMKFDGLYEAFATGSVVQKTDHYTSVIREPGKLEVNVRNRDIAKFGNRDERKTAYINRTGPGNFEKSDRGQKTQS